MRKLVGILGPVGLPGIEQDLQLSPGILYKAEEGATVSALDDERLNLGGLEVAPELTGNGITNRLDVTLIRLEPLGLDTVRRQRPHGRSVLLLPHHGSAEQHAECKNNFLANHGSFPSGY